jgi:phosphohistidine phosphatase
MKKLYLVRHAKSSWEDNKLKDIERPLNKRGKKDAPMMGKLLNQHKIKPDLLITSPAERALETAKIFSKELNILPENFITDLNLYEAGRKDILRIIHQFDNEKNTTMIFSHNPGLTDLACFLTSGTVCDIPTCGIVSLNCKIDNWNDLDDVNCELEFFEYPKKHSE